MLRCAFGNRSSRLRAVMDSSTMRRSRAEAAGTARITGFTWLEPPQIGRRSALSFRLRRPDRSPIAVNRPWVLKRIGVRSAAAPTAIHGGFSNPAGPVATPHRASVFPDSPGHVRACPLHCETSTGRRHRSQNQSAQRSDLSDTVAKLLTMELYRIVTVRDHRSASPRWAAGFKQQDAPPDGVRRKDILAAKRFAYFAKFIRAWGRNRDKARSQRSVSAYFAFADTPFPSLC
jgi:hypothetical protein